MSGTNSNAPTAPASGTPSSGGLTIINYGGSGAGSGFSLFAPTSFSTDSTGYSPISSSLLGSAQLALQEQANLGLQSIQTLGGAEFGTIASLFSSWTNSNNTLFTNYQNTFNSAVSKGANASSGLFGSIFGF